MELETLSAFKRTVRERRLRKERQRQEKILRDGQRIGIACPSRRFWIGRRCDGELIVPWSKGAPPAPSVYNTIYCSKCWHGVEIETRAIIERLREKA